MKITMTIEEKKIALGEVRCNNAKKLPGQYKKSRTNK